MTSNRGEGRAEGLMSPGRRPRPNLRGARGARSKDAEIDISPLIDVVFILLIFFMVTATFAKEMKLDLERPNAKSAVRASGETLRVSADREGQIYVGTEAVSRFLLEARVRDALQPRSDKTVLVVVHEGLASSELVSLVDACRTAGASAVAVATDREAG